MTLRLMKSTTFRDLVECQLLEIFPGQIRGINEAQKTLIAQYMDKANVDSYYKKLVYCSQGRDKFSKSTHHPNGLLFHKAGVRALFGINILFFEHCPSQPCFHFVLPVGSEQDKTIRIFIDKATKKFPDAKFYIIKMVSTQPEELVLSA